MNEERDIETTNNKETIGKVPRRQLFKNEINSATKERSGKKKKKGKQNEMVFEPHEEEKIEKSKQNRSDVVIIRGDKEGTIHFLKMQSIKGRDHLHTLCLYLAKQDLAHICRLDEEKSSKCFICPLLVPLSLLNLNKINKIAKSDWDSTIEEYDGSKYEWNKLS